MGSEVKRIVHDDITLAIIIPSDFHSEGIEFFTPGDYSQQLAYMNRPADHLIDPHVHNKVDRNVSLTLETLIIKSGRARLDLYTGERKFVESCELTAGDIVLLCAGGHGIQMLEQTEIVEVKQGPYAGDQDKTRFTPEPV